MDHSDNHRTNCATNLEPVKFPIESADVPGQIILLESSKRGKRIRLFGNIAKSAVGAVAIECRHRYGGSMKVISPTVIALVLWFLFFASHAFAVFKPPYPTKAQPPDSIIILATTALVPSPARQVNQTADENWHQTSGNAAFAFQRKPCAQILREQLTTASVQLTLFTAKVRRRLTSAAITAGCVDLQAHAF